MADRRGRDVPGDPGRAGHGPRSGIDGEVVSGEAAGNGGQQRLRLDDRTVPGGGNRGAQFPGAVGGVAVPGQRPVLAGCGLGGRELRGDRRV